LPVAIKAVCFLFHVSRVFSHRLAVREGCSGSVSAHLVAKVCARVPACHVCAHHGMHGDVCTQSCASVLLCRGSSVRRGRARDGDGPHMHARPRHAPADTPARFSAAKPLSTAPNATVMRSRRRRSRQRCASTEPSIRSFMRLGRACVRHLVADLIKEGANVNEKNHVSLNRVLSASA
jgi:hypothetical protein